jgi:HAD superfamily hydrolase (TIGR01509 family)
MLRNIIFDVDGTLIDSKRDIAAALHWVLAQLGVHSYAPEDLYPLIGKPLAEIFDTILPSSLHHRIEEASDLYKSHYPPRALETTTLFPGVVETLVALRLQGINLATATTKLSAGTRRILTHFGIAGHFAQIQGSDDMRFKPDPFIITRILTEQKWEKTDTLMVGDTDNDIEAGKRAGIKTCGVTYGSLSKEQITRLQPDFLIDSFPELLSVVGDHIR